MSGLNLNYVPITEIQGLLRDKDTGLPLRSGSIAFYKDQARTELKDIFKITGSPPNYSYVAIENPMTLTGIGTYSDGDNNDIIPYLYPYDENGQTELYFAEVYSEDEVFQFSREGFPNVGTVTPEVQDVQNYIPNGQFLTHIDIPASNYPVVYQAGQIRAPWEVNGITSLAQGGWTFERPPNSTATDLVTFVPYPAITNPSGNPRFYVQINTQSPSTGDTYKNLCLTFRGVNTFASTTQQYTFFFSGQTLAGSSTQVSLVLIKYFGAGGSPTTQTTLQTFNIQSGNAIYAYSFIFGVNTSKTIGSNNDDYVQLALSLPTGIVFNVGFTDFGLTSGIVQPTAYPDIPWSQTLALSLAGWTNLPVTDGSSLYLSPQLTVQGFQFDTSVIGRVYMESQVSIYVDSLHPTDTYMLADGSQYLTVDYSPLAVPYARLQSRYWNNTANVPIWGTGINYVTATSTNNTNELLLTTNAPGLVTDTADGTGGGATGFTFTTIHIGAAYSLNAYHPGAGEMWVEVIEPGDVAAATAGNTSPAFACYTIQFGSLISTISSVTVEIPVIHSKYWLLSSQTNGVTIHYYVWYKVDGVGTDPAVSGRTGILVQILSTDDDFTVCEKTRQALNGWQQTSIIMNAASTLQGGDYFTFSAYPDTNYYVWYTIGGVGIDPGVADAEGILVALAGTETAAQVVEATQIAINMQYFASPDLRGWFPRAWDNGAGIDPEESRRMSLVPGIMGDMIATLQFDSNQQLSLLYTGNKDDAGGNPGNINVGTANNAYTGNYESRPRNKALNFVIKY